MLFFKETYVERRAQLRQMVQHGVIVLFGNNDSPMNYPSNTYKFRQDSSFCISTDNTATDWPVSLMPILVRNTWSVTKLILTTSFGMAP